MHIHDYPRDDLAQEVVGDYGSNGYVALRKIFPSLCHYSLARSSRFAGCHLFHYFIIYSRSRRIVCPAVLKLSFIALGNNYTPTEELLDKEEEISASVRTGHQKPSGEASLNKDKSCRTGTETLQQLSEERIDFIRQRLDEWCADLGYKDCAVNMLTLSRTLSISKEELSIFFDQCMQSTFRIWLSEIRFNAAKKMMLDYPDYSNDIISAECGFSARTYQYRVFKTKEGCTPAEWREEQAATRTLS